MERFIYYSFITMIVALAVCCIFTPTHTYTVKVTFCDSRPPVFVNAESKEIITSEKISVPVYSPVTSWNQYLNVCELQTIRCLDCDTSKN